jgi:hypothetical protein
MIISVKEEMPVNSLTVPSRGKIDISIMRMHVLVGKSYGA